MKKIKIFISSVQKEFAAERQMLFDYLHGDPLLGKFFEPFIFEKLPASGAVATKVYLSEVEKCDIYLGIFGKEYGNSDAAGLSPTEMEFDHALLHSKTMLVFLTHHKANEREKKETDLIKKAEQSIVRKRFSVISELKSGVYASLVRYLEEKEIIRTAPFDAALHISANLDDIDREKIKRFVTIAKTKRNFPIRPESPPEEILTHLNLLAESRITNAALLLFGKNPQKYFISSDIKCAHFHGYDIVKPIPAYQVYKGDVFQIVDQAVDFVLSKIDLSVGERSKGVSVPVKYELPPAAVTEAIVNAVAHRDYTSNGSIQVMLFKDRLEIWNPGHLPFGLTTEKLTKPHHSIPTNPLLAEPMYLSGYIERMGTGTGDIIRLCEEAGLERPDFIQEEIFKMVIWRKQVTGQPTGQVTGQPTGQPTEHIKRVVMAIYGEVKRSELQKSLELKHRETFLNNYLNPSLEGNFIEMTHPESINHPKQRYRLTKKGESLKRELAHE